MKRSILVIEDDTYLRKFICSSLIKVNYNCIAAACGKDGIQMLKSKYFDLIILDLDLGDMNGQEILSLMRKQSIDLPVIIISTFNSINTKIDLFDIGCDDYITKPFYVDELLARVKRLIERTTNKSPAKNESLVNEIIQFDGMELNFEDLTLSKDGKKIDLTKKLFDLLAYFIKNANRVLTKEQIISRFWNQAENFPENTLTVHIHKLRSLIEDTPSKPKYLVTKRGHGYIFNT
ncbi:MAG: response regulator transcription factor [Spirochaetaceae bacterium]